MQFREEVDLPEHFYESQWRVMFKGKIDMIIDGVEHRFVKRDRYFIGKGVKHSGRIYPGYADMTFFNQQYRYKVKSN
jgi:hypothetical protein